VNKTLIPCLLLLVSALASSAQTVDCGLKGGGELTAAQQKMFQAIRLDTPDRAAVLFDMAIDYARAGNTQKSLSLLEEALVNTPWLDPSQEEVFQPLYGCAAFQKLVARVQQKYPPVTASHVVHTIPQKDLIPEGLASDSTDGTFYMSSIFHRKIVKIAPDGKISDFVAEAQDGLLGVLGVKVDSRDRSVWAASELRGQSALFHFSRSGKTLGKYAPQESGRHEFNDLVVTSKGDVLVTDDLDNAVYKLPHEANKLVRIDLQDRFYPNGIALATDEKSVYVAHAFGIVLMNLDGTAITEVQKPKDISLAQVDGLYVRQGSLIAIQNVFGGNRIVQLRLALDGKSILSGKLLEFRSPNLDLPTTGTIYKNSFYYIVNSQIDHEEDGKLRGEEKLESVRIAALKLD
jgi:sugar lactone lactonase YvrE